MPSVNSFVVFIPSNHGIATDNNSQSQVSDSIFNIDFYPFNETEVLTTIKKL